MKKRGISLVEILVTIAIIGGAIAVFSTLLSVLRINQATSIRSSAYKIAQEEFEVLRDLPVTKLNNRTNGNFINVMYNNGIKEVIANPIALSGPNVLSLTSSPSSTPGIILLPENNIADFTLEANVLASSTITKTGFIFHAKDLENYYSFSITNDRISLEKIVNGNNTTLYESLQTFNPNLWYKLKIVFSGSNISLYLNDNLLNNISDSDLTFGYTALTNELGTSYFDNITFISTDNRNWNFDNSINLPEEWKRYGLYDLPQGSGTLSISEPYTDSNIKQIDVTVSWVLKGNPKSITVSTLKTE